MRCSTSTARQLICCRFMWRIRGCLLIGFSWLMPRAYGRLFILQDGNSEGFCTASTPLLRGGLDLYREEFGRQRSGYILAYRTLKGGSGCGFSVGFTLFSPAPVFNFLLRADALAFLAFIGVSPLFAFLLQGLLPSTVLHIPYMQPARQSQPPKSKTPCPCFCNTCRPTRPP
jgi:hypothetical protein